MEPLLRREQTTVGLEHTYKTELRNKLPLLSLSKLYLVQIPESANEDSPQIIPEVSQFLYWSEANFSFLSVTCH